MVTVSSSPQCERMDKVSIVEQYNLLYLMNWWLWYGITAYNNDQVSRIWAVTVIFLYMANLLLPFPISCCWHGICDYEVIYSNIRLKGWVLSSHVLLPLFNSTQRSKSKICQL